MDCEFSRVLAHVERLTRYSTSQARRLRKVPRYDDLHYIAGQAKAGRIQGSQTSDTPGGEWSAAQRLKERTHSIRATEHGCRTAAGVFRQEPPRRLTDLSNGLVPDHDNFGVDDLDGLTDQNQPHRARHDRTILVPARLLKRCAICQVPGLLNAQQECQPCMLEQNDARRVACRAARKCGRKTKQNHGKPPTRPLAQVPEVTYLSDGQTQSGKASKSLRADTFGHLSSKSKPKVEELPARVSELLANQKSLGVAYLKRESQVRWMTSDKHSWYLTSKLHR
jgi:hypothetical protein